MPETNGNVNPVSQSVCQRNEAKFFENAEKIFAGAEPLKAGFGLLHFNKSPSGSERGAGGQTCKNIANTRFAPAQSLAAESINQKITCCLKNYEQR